MAFYPDYVVHMKDSTDWVIETKGGEVAGHSKNIDMQAENKFNAFKNYAEKYHLKWGFVRDESVLGSVLVKRNTISHIKEFIKSVD